MPVVIVPAGVVVALFIAAIGLATAYLAVFLVGFLLAGLFWILWKPVELLLSEKAAIFAAKSAGTLHLKPEEISKSILNSIKPQLTRFSALDVWHFACSSHSKHGHRENTPVIHKDVEIGSLSQFFGFKDDWRLTAYIGYYVGLDNVIVVFAGPAYNEFGESKYNIYTREYFVSHYENTYFNGKKMKFTTSNPAEATSFILKTISQILRNIDDAEAKKISDAAAVKLKEARSPEGIARARERRANCQF